MSSANIPPEQRRLAYLAKAEEARRLARTVKDEEARQSFETIARGWRDLADQVVRSHLDGKFRSRRRD